MSHSAQGNCGIEIFDGVDYSEISHSQRPIALKQSSQAFADAGVSFEKLDRLEDAPINDFVQPALVFQEASSRNKPIACLLL